MAKPRTPSASPMSLSFHAVPMPTLEAMSPLLREQLGPLLEQALDDGPDGLLLFDRFEIREGASHAFDLALFAGDDGAVYRAGTLERVASFSQGGATGSRDAALIGALDAGLAGWRKAGKAKLPSAVAAATPPPAARPRLSQLGPQQQMELGKKLRGGPGLLRITTTPSPAMLSALRAHLAANAASTVVEIAAAAPLSIVEHLGGIPFVVIGAGRRSFDGLQALPQSVKRLSIRKQTRLTLAGLPSDNDLRSLEIEAPEVGGGASLPRLTSLGWTGAEDASFIEQLPRLDELALRRGKLTELPASPTLQRLLLFSPSKLATLRGIERLPRLRFLRVDRPTGMKRLGSLARCTALEVIALVGAHAIADLSDLSSAPALEHLGVVQSKVEPATFEALRGKLKRGSFQLRLPKQGQALLAHLGVPYATIPLIENDFFDVP